VGHPAVGDSPLAQFDVHLSPRFIQQRQVLLPHVIQLSSPSYLGGKLTAEDALKSIQNSKCILELVSVQVGA